MYRSMKMMILLMGNTSHMEVNEEFNRLHTQSMCSLKGVPYFSLWFQTYGTFCIFPTMIHLSFCCHSVPNNIHQKPNEPLSGAEILNSVWNEIMKENVQFINRHSSWTSWPLRMAPISCPKTSVWNYHSTLLNMPEKWTSQIYRRISNPQEN
jgi:hypothetical protein